MRKGLLSLLLFAVVGLSAVHAYDFSVVVPSGQTLYFTIRNTSSNEVTVVWPNASATDIAGIYTGYTEPAGNLVIPSTVTYNGTTYTVTSMGTAFANCEGLTSVTIPNSVTSIGEYAFYNCIGLTSVTIPNSVTSIENYAFSYCSGLTSVTIPNSVTSIGYDAFYSVRHIIYNGTATGSPWGALSVNGYIEGDFVYANNTKTSLLAYIGTSTSVTIPNSVITIGLGAFAYCTGLTSVTIPNSVTSIGRSAFYNCSGLTSVTIPNSVTAIGEYAFAYCTGLTSVTIPNSVTSIGDYAFYYCSGLTSVTIPNSVTSIGYAAFSGCSGLTTLNFNATNYSSSFYDGEYYQFYNCPISTINIGDNVQQIPASFAPNLNSLSAVTIPNSVTHIGAYAFRNCTGLASIIMGDSVDYIYEYAFYNTAYYLNDANWEDDLLYINNWLIAAKQSSQGEYVIKDNTRGIASFAFSSCSTIRSIKSKSEVPPMGSTWDIPTTTTINVPCQALSAYLTHSDWSAFTNIQAVPYDVELLVNNPTMGSVGFISNTCSSTIFQAFPNSGYIFQSWSDGNTQNPRILINLANDTTITASFAAEGTTTPDSNTIVIYDTVYINIHDTTYITQIDTITNTVYDTITNTVYDTITNTVYDTTYVPIHDTTYITQIDTVTNTVYDTITNTVYDTIDNFVYDTVYITETDTLWLFDTIYMHDTIYIYDTIYIRDSTTGIEDVSVINAKIYSSRSRIVVEGADGNSVMLFDMQGRLLSTKQDEYSVLEFEVPISGAYFVKIGNYKAKKVVVIK